MNEQTNEHIFKSTKIKSLCFIPYALCITWADSLKIHFVDAMSMATEIVGTRAPLTNTRAPNARHRSPRLHSTSLAKDEFPFGKRFFYSSIQQTHCIHTYLSPEKKTQFAASKCSACLRRQFLLILALLLVLSPSSDAFLCFFFLLSIALSSNTNESNFGWIFAILILHQKTFAFLPVFICFCRYFAVSLLWAQETEVSKCVRHTIVANLSQEKCAQVMQNLFICMCEFQPNDNKYRLLPQENAIQNSISELYSECEDEKEWNF